MKWAEKQTLRPYLHCARDGSSTSTAPKRPPGLSRRLTPAGSPPSVAPPSPLRRLPPSLRPALSCPATEEGDPRRRSDSVSLSTNLSPRLLPPSFIYTPLVSPSIHIWIACSFRRGPRPLPSCRRSCRWGYEAERPREAGRREGGSRGRRLLTWTCALGAVDR
jgi:hypothetical protein